MSRNSCTINSASAFDLPLTATVIIDAEALQIAQVDVLWRISDEAGEPVLASPLVQQLAHEGGAREAADARAVRELVGMPVARPQARAAGLPVDRLSASAYEDLRKCPYRFFA